MLTLWILLSLASGALAVWHAVSELARHASSSATAVASTRNLDWRRLGVVLAVAMLLLLLGDAEQGYGFRAALACALGAAAAAGADQFARHAAARLGDARVLGRVLATATAGFGLGGLALLLLVFADAHGVPALAFTLGAAAAAWFARDGGQASAEQFVALSAAALAAALIRRAAPADVSLQVYPLLALVCGLAACHGGAGLIARLQWRLPGQVAAAALFALAMALVTWLLAPAPHLRGGEVADPWRIYLALMTGLAVVPTLGLFAEQVASVRQARAQELAQQSQQGAAANLAHGLASGMASIWQSAVLLAFAVWATNYLAGGYGTALAAVGGLALLTTTPPPVASPDQGAHGRGRLNGALALTALAWLGVVTPAAGIGGIDLDNPNFVPGMLAGAMLPFALAAALALPERDGGNDWRGAMLPIALAMATPLLVGLVFGRAAVAGALLAAVTVGVLLGQFLANAGGAWAGALAYVQQGHLGGPGSPTHDHVRLGAEVGGRWRQLPLSILLLLAAAATALALPLFG